MAMWEEDYLYGYDTRIEASSDTEDTEGLLAVELAAPSYTRCSACDRKSTLVDMVDTVDIVDMVDTVDKVDI